MSNSNETKTKTEEEMRVVAERLFGKEGADKAFEMLKSSNITDHVSVTAESVRLALYSVSTSENIPIHLKGDIISTALEFHETLVLMSTLSQLLQHSRGGFKDLLFSLAVNGLENHKHSQEVAQRFTNLMAMAKELEKAAREKKEETIQ